MYQKLKTGVWCQNNDKEMRVIFKIIFKLSLAISSILKKFF